MLSFILAVINIDKIAHCLERIKRYTKGQKNTDKGYKISFIKPLQPVEIDISNGEIGVLKPDQNAEIYNKPTDQYDLLLLFDPFYNAAKYCLHYIIKYIHRIFNLMSFTYLYERRMSS